MREVNQGFTPLTAELRELAITTIDTPASSAMERAANEIERLGFGMTFSQVNITYRVTLP